MTTTPMKPCHDLKVEPGHDLLVMETNKMVAVCQIADDYAPYPDESLAFSPKGVPHDLLDRLDHVGLVIEPVPGLGIPVCRVLVRNDAERLAVRMMFGARHEN